MDPKHYVEKKVFRIYAMLLKAEEHYVYVGKSMGKRMSAVYSRHVTGKVKATEGYFDQGEKVECYLLEELMITTSEAYKHVVAWCHLFQRAGYVGINHERTLHQADNLLPDTKAIVEQLSQEPLDRILQRTLLARPADADRGRETSVSAEVACPKSKDTVQINIRMCKHDKALFERFCEKASINQREGFQILLDQISESRENTRTYEVLQKRNETIARLEKKNQKLKGRLDSWITNGKSPEEKRIDDKLSFMKNGINQYLQMMFPENVGKSSLPETSYKRYVRDLPFEEKPQYPEEEGFLVLQLEAILWGNPIHRPCFLVGRGEDGKRYKLRCYPRAEYTGFLVRESRYASPGSHWFVGCQKSKDGAMELMAAFPIGLPDEERYEPKRMVRLDISTDRGRKPALDRMIEHADIKKNKL